MQIILQWFLNQVYLCDNPEYTLYFQEKIQTKQQNNMSFQGYLKTILAKTGKGPDDFRKLAEEKGFTAGGQLKGSTKAGDIVQWLKTDFDLGQGHAMAIYALLKGTKDEHSA